MASSRQEIWWVLRAQSGDREALDALLKAVQQPLYRYLFRLVGERTLAEDLLQEVFLRIYRKLRWLHEPALFRPWIFRIASREAFKRLKREKQWREQVREEAVLETIPAPYVEPGLALEAREHLTELLSRVSPAGRAVLLLHYLEEMTLEEVAEVLGIPLGTVKSRLAYGLSCLRRILRERDQAGIGSDE